MLRRPSFLDYSRARAYCDYSRFGRGLFGHYYSHLLFFSLSPSLWETARHRLKYCLKGPLNQNQPTNSRKLVVYYILDYFGILFILDINSVLRESILWDQILSKGLFCEKF